MDNKSAGTAEFWRGEAVLSMNKLVATADPFPKLAATYCVLWARKGNEGGKHLTSVGIGDWKNNGHFQEMAI